MPSLLVLPVSGGATLVSGDIFSGNRGSPQGVVQLYLDTAAPGPIYVGFHRHPAPSDLTPWSGNHSFSGVVTITSGGTLSSGGLADGMLMRPGDSHQIPKLVLVSGILDIRYATPAGSSGGRLFFEWY